VNVNSPILCMSSDLTRKDRMSAALRWSCQESEPVQKSSLNCGKLLLTNGAAPLSPGRPARGAPARH
jgi:hypothetical protein